MLSINLDQRRSGPVRTVRRRSTWLSVLIVSLWVPARVLAQSPGDGFLDDFSAYPAGWSGSGNSSVAADPSIFVSAPRSVRLSGFAGWEALIHRPVNAVPPFTVQGFVYPGAGGSTSFHGRISLSQLPDWHGGYRSLLSFDQDGVIR